MIFACWDPFSDIPVDLYMVPVTLCILVSSSFFELQRKTKQCTAALRALVLLCNPELLPCVQKRKKSEAKRTNYEARQKNADHPVFDANNRRRLHPFDFCALSFERHGYWAKETVGFTKKFAYARATALGLEPSSEICRWYGVISCCIQRANAKILRGEPVPGRHATPVPGGMFSLGRDLRLVTG